MVDRTLVKHSSSLASRAVIIDGLHARLALIDAGQNIDKYYILQGIEDPEQKGDVRFFSYQHWGRTGTAGDGKLEGPMELSEVKKRIAKVFKEKTGAEWGSIKPGSRAPPGKYWLQQAAIPDMKATWEYFVGDGVDGKQPGWYPYTEDACEEVESLHAQHEANGREGRTASRVVDSGYFSYKVNLDDYSQQNTRTGKLRKIRRVVGSGEGSQPATAMDLAVAAKAKLASSCRVAKVSQSKVTTVLKFSPKRSAIKVVKKSMKKAMKAKMTTRIAKGKYAKAAVWRGKKEKTSSGLKQDDLKKNKDGKIVTKKKSARGRIQFKHVARWISACKQARHELGVTGFVAFKKGSPLYEKAKELYPTVEPHVLE